MSSALTNLWRQLVQRRLWPVAILLIAALAAVPMALAKDAEPALPADPVRADTSEGDVLATQPIVARAATTTKRRKVLGTPKNPFGVPKDKTASGTSTVVNKAPDPGEGSNSSPASGGTSPSGTGSTPAPSTPVTSVPAPQPAPKTYEMHELTVRFGDVSGATDRRSLKRLQPLPSAEEPVLIYLGVLSDGKTAVFLVDHGVSALGDGECRPSPEECETVRLRAGETEFFDVTDETGAVSAQYQLDLIKIHKSTTASAARATASSKAGRRLLKARVSADGPTGYRWDAAAGTLERRQALRATFAGSTVALP